MDNIILSLENVFEYFRAYVGVKLRNIVSG